MQCNAMQFKERVKRGSSSPHGGFSKVGTRKSAPRLDSRIIAELFRDVNLLSHMMSVNLGRVRCRISYDCNVFTGTFSLLLRFSVVRGHTDQRRFGNTVVWK